MSESEHHTDDLSLTVGSISNDHVGIRIIQRESAANHDFWDGNWLQCRIEIRASGFQGAYSANLRTDEFSRFLNQLEQLHEKLGGKAEFRSTEMWLAILIECDRRGELNVFCEARDGADGPTLTFGMKFDQTFLVGMIKQLREVLRQYPVIGGAVPGSRDA